MKKSPSQRKIHFLKTEKRTRAIGRARSQVLRWFPNIPDTDRESVEHASTRENSGRAMSRDRIDKRAVVNAVRAHIRHRHTDYDERLKDSGTSFHTARELVRAQCEAVMRNWGYDFTN